MNKLISILSVLFLFSCGSEKGKRVETLADGGTDIESSILVEDVFATLPSHVACIDTCILLFNGQPGSAALILSSHTGQEIGSIGERGNGPGEFYNATYAGYDAKKKIVYIYDSSQNRMKSYYFYLEASGIEFQFIEEFAAPDGLFITSICRLESGHFAGLLLNGEGGMYVLLDSQMNLLKRFGDNPLHEKVNTNSPFQGNLKSYGNSFYYAALPLAYVACYGIHDDNVEMKWENMMIQPIYESDGTVIYDKEKHGDGFYGLAVTKEYIFLTYSGKPSSKLKPDGSGMEPNTLVVLNHSGELLKKFNCKENIFKLATSEDEKTLYIVGESSEVIIEKYNIKQLMGI